MARSCAVCFARRRPACRLSIMRRILLAFAALFACAVSAYGEETAAALNLAAPEALLDLGPSLSARNVNDPTYPEDAWFTVPVQNRSSTPVIRVLAAADRPESALAASPPRT